MAEKKRIAFIGTGGRCNSYAGHIDQNETDFVACADPSEANRKAFIALNKINPAIQQYDNWHDLFAKAGPLDGVVISTPNHLHTEPGVEAMRRGLALALEKPIAESADGCRKLLAAKREHDARVLIGFVMRSAPYYRQARQWIDEGRIGRVATIQADEIVHLLTVGVMFRSPWRRFVKTSGGSLLEKCCHDIDMITWMAGGAPVAINSFAGRKTLAPRTDVPKLCDDCHITDTCSYYLPNEVYDGPARTWGNQDADLYKFIANRGECIYNNGHDIFDHQVVQIQYDNGVLANFTSEFGTVGHATGRNLKIFGDKGVIWGKTEEKVIYLQDKQTDKVIRQEIKEDGSGHAGANRAHALAFLRLMTKPDEIPSATLEAGYLSAMLCFAADQSVREKRQVDVSHLMDEAGLKRGFEV